MNRALELLLCGGILLTPGPAIADTYRDTSTLFVIRRIQEGLTAFEHDVGRLPSSTEGLAALREDPGIGPAWRGPYGSGRNAPTDAWGEPLVYHHPPLYAPAEYDLYSKGVNEVDDRGEGDDITNWSGIRHQFYPRPMPWAALAIGLGFLVFLAALVLGATVAVRKLRGRSAA